MEDEGNHGNDDTRCFILSTLAALQWSRVTCVLCRAAMLVFDRYPLVDGTFFLSPRQHSPACAEVCVCFTFDFHKFSINAEFFVEKINVQKKLYKNVNKSFIKRFNKFLASY